MCTIRDYYNSLNLSLVSEAYYGYLVRENSLVAARQCDPADGSHKNARSASVY